MKFGELTEREVVRSRWCLPGIESKSKVGVVGVVLGNVEMGRRLGVYQRT